MLKRIGNIFLLLGVLYTLTPTPVQAEMTVQARLSAQTVTIRDTVMLTIEVRGSDSIGIDSIKLPDFKGLSVIGTSQSSQFAFVNGKVSHSKQFNYRLAPTEEGTVVIPPLTILVNGRELTTEQLTLMVGRSTAGPSMPQPAPQQQVQDQKQQASMTNQPMFLEASVSNTSPYAGEQIIYTVKFYRRVRLVGEITYYPPDLTGFTIFQGDDKQKTRSYRETLGGYEYQVDEINTILIPGLVAQGIVIPKAKVVIQMGFFEPARTIESQAIPVHVRQLPSAESRAFKGAVGEYALKIHLDKTQVKVGEAINATIAVSGQGNLNMLPLPRLPLSEEIKKYDSKERTDIKIVDNVLTGTKRAEIILVPGVAGTYSLQPVTLTFFSPRKGTYITTSASLPDITVHKADPSAAAGNNADSVHIVSQQPVQAKSNDIVFIKDNPSLSVAAVPYKRAGYLISLLAGIVIIAINGILKTAAALRLRKSGELQKKNAVRNALSQLRHIRRNLAKLNPSEASSRMNSALRSAIAFRFSLSPQGITRTDMRELCQKEGVPENIIDRFITVIDTCEMNSYGSVTSETNVLPEVCRQAEEALRSLEKFLR